MGIETDIAWTDHTWNPWQGCHKVSPGCLHCYMERDKKRYGQDPFTVVRSKPDTFNAPLSKKWASPGRVFVCSWSDFFIEEADPWRAEAWEIIRKAYHLTFQICTKRPERIAKCLPSTGCPSNVWLGVTAEDQENADRRIPLLVAVPAPVYFVSVEPQIGMVHLAQHMFSIDWVICGGESGPDGRPFDLSWARLLRDQCKSSGAAFFMKQLGRRPFSFRTDDQLLVNDLDGRDPTEWPADLRVRQFPVGEISAHGDYPLDDGSPP